MQPPAADRHLFGRLLERVSVQETEHELRRKLLTRLSEKGPSEASRVGPGIMKLVKRAENGPHGAL